MISNKGCAERLETKVKRFTDILFSSDVSCDDQVSKQIVGHSVKESAGKNLFFHRDQWKSYGKMN